MLRMRVHGPGPGVKTGQTDKQADRQRKGWGLEDCSLKMCQTVWRAGAGSVHWTGGTRWTGREVQKGVNPSSWA